MIHRNLDESGDWMFGRGKANFVIGDAAIALNIKTRINSWLRDCFFAPGEGIDWFNRLGSKDQRDLLESDLRSIILRSEGVTGIIDFNITLDRATRTFTANFSITTADNDEFLITLPIGATNA